MCWIKSKKGKNGKIWYSYIVLRWTELMSKIQDFKFFFFSQKRGKGKNVTKNYQFGFFEAKKSKTIWCFKYGYIVLRWTGLMSKIWNFRIFFQKKGRKRGKMLLKNKKIGFFEAKKSKEKQENWSCYIVVRWTELRSENLIFQIFFYGQKKGGKRGIM